MVSVDFTVFQVMNMSESWVDRYRPKDWSSIQGNNSDLKEIRSWVENWSRGDNAVLLHGDPGTGKTSTAFVAADHMDVPINKINLSLKRRSAELKQAARSAMSTPPDEDYQVVLMDEIDNMYHSVNKDPLYDVLDDPRNPIIITANDKYDVPDAVTKRCDVYKFTLGVRSRKAKIREIAEEEDMDISTADLNRLAQRPDLRSAINDLQTLAQSDVPIGKDHRTWAEGEFSAVEALVKGNDEVWKGAISLNDDTFDRIDDAILWADDNLTLQFRGLEAGVAYEMLALADLWAGRAWERNNFRYQKFGYALLECLPEARLTDPYTGYIQENMFPRWFRHSEDKWDGNSPEAQAYQGMKGERGYTLSANYFEFKNRILPILRDLDVEERMELALNSNLAGEAVEALDLDPGEYEKWTGEDSVEEGDGWSPESNSAASADW